ncbi:MAG TPA: hypothetical protein VKG01_01940 [Thermoanaerobaculia bacterium]|nr:hypothetical protein [Thermoanaerobaculia bacterium]
MAKGPDSGGVKAVAKYLQRHAEPDAAGAAGIQGTFGHAVVVPAYAEGDPLFAMLGSVPAGPSGDVLIVLVLNARADSSEAARQANAATRERLARELPASVEVPGEVPLLVYPLPHGRLVLVDRSLPGRWIPEGQGVGLARKIGCDIALSLQAAGRVASPWIHATDADTLLPGDYFDQVKRLDPAETGAAIYSFEHRFDPDPSLGAAARLYEISLRYYVLGLAWSGSPYAYESMGSCLAIPAVSYASVRGFPRRNALEDFHALNKLAKVGTIQRLAGTPVLLEGRVSDRVPISTGQAIQGLVGRKGAMDGFSLYHPAVFAHLAAWIRVLGAIARSRGDMQAALVELPEQNPFFRTDLLQSALGELGAFEAVREAISLSKDSATLLRHLHTWFDALRTQRLIHLLRDGGLPSLGWLQALDEAPFTGLTSSTEEEPEMLRRHLFAEEKKLSEFPAGLPSLTLSN